MKCPKDYTCDGLHIYKCPEGYNGYDGICYENTSK